MKLLAILIFLLLPGMTLANDWDALRLPGAVALMRHALAPGTGDPSHFDIADCDTQRNLDARGRAQANDIAEALKVRSIVFDTVLTSQWCRCRETAELLGAGPVQSEPMLNSFFRDRGSAEVQTTAIEELMRRSTGPLMMVTHQVNITALTDVFPSSGEIIVIRWTSGAVEVIGRIKIDP